MSLFPDATTLCEFSSDRTYRYWWERRWDESLPSLGFVMLNPSQANETDVDPTVFRCLSRAKKNGYGRLVVVNLFALVSTDPAGLYEHPLPVGEGDRNDRAILRAAKECRLLIAGWGVHGSFADRCEQVRRLLDGHEIWCLGTTKAGQPRHPLYVSYQQRAVRYSFPTTIAAASSPASVSR